MVRRLLFLFLLLLTLCAAALIVFLPRALPAFLPRIAAYYGFVLELDEASSVWGKALFGTLKAGYQQDSVRLAAAARGVRVEYYPLITKLRFEPELTIDSLEVGMEFNTKDRSSGYSAAASNLNLPLKSLDIKQAVFDISIDGSRFLLKTPFRADSAKMSLGPGTFETESLRLTDFKAEVSDLNLFAPAQARGNLQFSGALELVPTGSEPIKLRAQAVLETPRFKADLVVDESIPIGVNAAWDKTRPGISASISQVEAEDIIRVINKLPWTAGYVDTVAGGKANAAFRYDWTAKKAEEEAQLSVEIKDLNAVIGGIPVAGLDASAVFLPLSEFVTSKPAGLKAKEVIAGLPLKDVEASLAVGAAKSGVKFFTLSGIKASLAGGTLTASDLRFYPGKAPELLVELQGVDISRILAEHSNQERVKATGIVDGILPLIFRPEGVIIEEGRLRSRPPGGLIQTEILPEGASPGDNRLKIAAEALRSFEYSELSALVKLNAAGDLLLELTLKGSSAQVNKGQLIHVNIAVQENIPALMKSLAFSRGLPQELVQAMSK